MPNIYLKVTIEKNWCSQNFDYLSLKIHLQVSFWEAPTHADASELNFLLQLKIKSWSKSVCGFIILILKGFYVLKSNSPYFLLNRNINFNQIETEFKIKNPTHTFRDLNVVLQLI